MKKSSLWRTELVTLCVLLCAAESSVAQVTHTKATTAIHCTTTRCPASAESSSAAAKPVSPSPNELPEFPETDGPDQLNPAADLEPGAIPANPVVNITPTIIHNIVSSDDVFTVYTKPLYTTAIRLPSDVTSIAVGAPTLFKAEHAKGQPRLIFVKPSTHQPADSDLIIALSDGGILSIHLISPGDEASKKPVDFLVDYTQPQSLVLAQLGSLNGSLSQPSPSLISAPVLSGYQPYKDGARAALQTHRRVAPRDVFSGGTSVLNASPLSPYLKTQEKVASQTYLDGHDLARLYPADKYATDKLGVAFGAMHQDNDTVTFAYSVVNKSNRWIEVLPPEIQFENPGQKRESRKHPKVLAETIPIESYLVSGRKLPPHGRLDGVVRFERPSFKEQKEKLMLQLAPSDAIDRAVLIPVPFIAPENTGKAGKAHGTRHQ
jgi:hypothetical protein